MKKFGYFMLFFVVLMGGCQTKTAPSTSGQANTSPPALPVVITPSLKMQGDPIVGIETRDTELGDDTIHYFLATTEPGAIEENPLFWWELTIVNGRSHTPLPADVFVYWRPADSSPDDFEQLACVCRQQVQCRFAFPGRYADVLYRVEVKAAGYVLWSRDFRTNTQRTRTMKAPVELFEAGLQG